MKKAVIQSYIGTIPEWRQECINTVKHWCKNNDIDYIWYDSPSGIIEARFGLKEVPHVSFQKFEWIEATKGYDSLMWVDTDIVVQGNPQFEWESEFTIENRLRNFEGVTISHPQGGLFYGTRLYEMAEWVIGQSYLPWSERHDTINYLVSLWNFTRPNITIYDQDFIGVWIDQFGHTETDPETYNLWQRTPYDCDANCFIHFVSHVSRNKAVQYQQYLMFRMWQKKQKQLGET